MCDRKSKSLTDVMTAGTQFSTGETALTTGEKADEISARVLYEQELSIIRGFQKPTVEDLVPKQVWLGERTKRCTLFLDLDETLVSARGHGSSDEEQNVTIIVRPMAISVLATLSKVYELVIFTAAAEEYAVQAVRCLDPEGRYIKRVLTNKHCVRTKEGYFVKDLRVVADRKLEEMLIVDNSIISFAFQLANGIPVSSYEGDEQDTELCYLSTYLLELAEANDVVGMNSLKIGLGELAIL